MGIPMPNNDTEIVSFKVRSAVVSFPSEYGAQRENELGIF